MSLLTVCAYFFGVVTIVSATAILVLKNIFHAALALLVCLLSIAALFIVSNAEFPGVAQILLYAGGVVVIIIFGIMLTNKATSNPKVATSTNLLPGLLAGGGLFFLLVYFIQRPFFSGASAPDRGETIKTIGTELLTDYVLPFEMAGVLLLAVLVGAATLAGYRSDKRNA